MLRTRPLLAFVLLAVSALPAAAGLVMPEELTLQELVDRSEWIVEASPATPPSAQRKTRCADGSWCRYGVGRWVVHRTMRAPEGARPPALLDAVDALQPTWENLGKRASSKSPFVPELSSSEGTCPATGPRILFFRGPNDRGEFIDAARNACLPISAWSRVEDLARGASSRPVQVFESNTSVRQAPPVTGRATRQDPPAKGVETRLAPVPGEGKGVVERKVSTPGNLQPRR